MISLIKRKFQKSELARNTLFLTSGTLVSQLIAIGVSPIISRMYSPEEFGVYGQITAFCILFINIAALKYDDAIVLAKSSFETRKLINWSEGLIIVLAILATISYTLFYGLQNSFVTISIFVIVFLNGNVRLLINILTRYKAFSKVSIGEVVNKIFSSLTQVIIGVFSPHLFGLVLGQINGAIGFLFHVLRKSSLKSIYSYFDFNHKSYQEAKPILLEHYRFPLYRAPQIFLNSISQNIPILILGIFFGGSVVGYYWFAFRILQLPLTAISGAIRKTVYQKGSVTKSKDELFNFLMRATLTLISVGIPIFSIGFLFLPDLFRIIFGEEWLNAGEYGKWLIPWVFTLFINSPSIALISVLNLQKFSLIYDILLLVFRLAAILIGGYYFDPLTTIILFSIVGVVFNLFIIVFILNNIKRIKWN